MTSFRVILWILFLSAFFFYFPLSSKASSVDPSDTIFSELPDFDVVQKGKSALRPDVAGNLQLSSDATLRMMRSFGEADMIAAIKGLGGIISAGDYGSGLSIDGADPSQTIYLIDGIPVIFPYRFGGIFSTFNTPHFARMDFNRSAIPASSHSRLGSSLSFIPADAGGKRISGTANFGILSSSITLKSSLSEKFYALASARVSYIDLLYGKLLKGNSSVMKYNFQDFNLTIGYRPSPSDTINLNLLVSNDILGYDDSNYISDTKLKWRNLSAGATWRHGGSLPLTLRAYYSLLDESLNLGIPQISIKAPSKINLAGCRVDFNSDLSNSVALTYGIHLEYGHSVPQYAVSEYNYLFSNSDLSLQNSNHSSSISQDYLYSRAFASSLWSINDNLRLETGLSAGIYHSKITRPIIDPRITLTYFSRAGDFMIHVGGYSQYLHQVGFSDLGLASNFWIAANDIAPLQHSLNLNINWQRPLGIWGISAEAGAYFSLVDNQIEYRGNVLEIIDTDYNPFCHLINSKGFNTGAHVSLRRNFGALTGMIGYSFGYGRRHAPDATQSGKNWASPFDPGHSLNASLNWAIGLHWDLSANFRYASGRVYTPVEALYLISGNLAMQYGPRNSRRLPAYHRLDIGATYKWESGSKHPLRHLLNISLLNAYGHNNVEMQYFIINSESGDYTLKRLYSLYRFLPSVSYSIMF